MCGYVRGPFLCGFPIRREVHDAGLSLRIQRLAEILEVPLRGINRLHAAPLSTLLGGLKGVYPVYYLVD